jgi:hypothetical protein
MFTIGWFGHVLGMFWYGHGFLWQGLPILLAM